MKILNNNEFINFDELEEVNVVEIENEMDATKGGIHLVSSEDDYHARWDLLINGGEYQGHTNLANAFYDRNEIITNDELITITKVIRETQVTFIENQGWENYEHKEEEKIIIIIHKSKGKIIANLTFRWLWYDFEDEIEYIKEEKIREKNYKEEKERRVRMNIKCRFDENTICNYCGLGCELEEIEELEEVEEIEEEEFFQHCKECSHPLGHLFLDQCPCGYKKQ